MNYFFRAALKVKRLIRKFGKLEVREFLKRYEMFLSKGYSQQIDQSLLRNATFATSGKALDRANAAAEKYLSKYVYKDPALGSTILNLTENDCTEAYKSLETLGFWIAPNKVSAKHLDNFQRNAEKEIRALCKADDVTPIELGHKNSSQKDREMISLSTEFVLSQELPYLLATSTDVLNIVGKYFGTNPILNLPDSWFSFPVENLASGSAQNWHIDCDRVKWLKVFVYITDVDLSNGPHSFIATTHKKWRLKTNNSRFMNDDVQQKFESSEIQVFTGARGTVIFEDTRGLHKGTPLVSGHRLILQLEFATDSFGYIHPIFNVPKEFSGYLISHSSLFPRDRFELSAQA